MWQRLARHLLAGAALGLTLAATAPLAVSAEEATQAKPAVETPLDPASINSFAGAYLAARTADTDYDFASAVEFYKRARELDPTNLEIQERLMLALFLSGRFDEGVEIAEQLKNDPAIERITTISRGIDAIRDMRFDEARKILTYGGPNDLERMVHTLVMAWGVAGDGKVSEAIAIVDKMEGPEWFAIFKAYTAGMIAYANGDIETARSRLSAAVADRDGGSAAVDTYVRSVIALATLEAKAGNKQKALDAIAAGEAFAPNYSPLQIYRTRIQSNEVIDPQVSNTVEGVSSVLFAVGGALNQSITNEPERQGGQDIVAFYLETAHALDPDAADTLVLLGGLAENLNQPERAIGYFARVPQNSPLRRISEMQLGLDLAQIGKTDEAKKHLKALIQANPNDVRAYAAYGGVLSDTKEYEEMAKVFDKAVEIIGPLPKKTHWNIFFQRGIAYERLKKWPQAEPNFRKALELNPDQPQVLNYLGYSWVDMNMNLEEGLGMIRRAVDLRPDDGYIVDSLGWAYYRLGRFDDATAELERAVELKAGDPTINDHLGDAYWRVGRKLEAVYQWQRALTMKPEASEIPKIEAKIKNGLPPIEARPSAKKTENGKTEDGKADTTLPSDPTMLLVPGQTNG